MRKGPAGLLPMKANGCKSRAVVTAPKKTVQNTGRKITKNKVELLDTLSI
jgi:hypothetical protein